MVDEQRQAPDRNPGPRGWLLCAGLTALTAVVVLKAAVISLPVMSGVIGAWYIQAGIVAGAVAAYSIGEALIGRADRQPVTVAAGARSIAPRARSIAPAARSIGASR
jgi:hypothetical protein